MGLPRGNYLHHDSHLHLYSGLFYYGYDWPTNFAGGNGDTTILDEIVKKGNEIV